MKLTVDFEEKMLQEVQDKLGSFHKKAPNAIANALNRAATTVNKNTKLEVRKKYVIKSSDVQKTLTKSKANRSNLGVVVKSEGALIGLEKFKIQPKTINPKRKSPIKIGVKKGNLKTVMGAFVANINGPKAFERSTDKRLPINRLFGPSVPQMLENEEVRSEIEQTGQETFEKRLDHEINRILDKGRANS